MKNLVDELDRRTSDKGEQITTRKYLNFSSYANSYSLFFQFKVKLMAYKIKSTILSALVMPTQLMKLQNQLITIFPLTTRMLIQVSVAFFTNIMAIKQGIDSQSNSQQD